ncbi:YjbQ family protein [Nocardiopsis rhodophaea]|uniref:YjbQ family protein n=1 Tax=Nocardiopsis rhodophaea TaxID=280238 RepID=UPI0031DF3885
MIRELEVESTGYNFTCDLTDRIAELAQRANRADGMLSVFARGSTIGLTLMRYEPGAVQDLQRAMERIAPSDAHYVHGLTTSDPNGFSHVRSSIMGTSLSVPFIDGRLGISDAHRIAFFDFDLKPATRKIHVGLPTLKEAL